MSANGPAIVLSDPPLDARVPITDTPVLVLEGNDRDRAVIDAVLQTYGLRCVVTADPAEARRWLSEAKPRLTILSADVVRGLNLAFWLKKDAAMRCIPQIVISGRLSPETIQEHQRLPTRADVYLQRPLDSAVLASAVIEILSGITEVGRAAAPTASSSEPLLKRELLEQEDAVLRAQLEALEAENQRIREESRVLAASEAQTRELMASLEAGYRQAAEAAEREKIALRVALTNAQDEIEALKGRLAADNKGPGAVGNG